MSPQPKESQSGPLDPILGEIETAFSAGLYYAAVAICLTLPDICSALEIEEGHARFGKIEKRYKAWFEQYVAAKFSTFNADDCWALRGGVVHNAMLSKHPKNTRGRIILMPPHATIVIHEMLAENVGPKGESALQIDIRFFCANLIGAVKDWWKVKGDDPVVTANIPDLMRLRPGGLAPFTVGIPLIA